MGLDQGILSRRGFTHHADALIKLFNHMKTGADDGMVIHQQQAYGSIVFHDTAIYRSSAVAFGRWECLDLAGHRSASTWARADFELRLYLVGAPPDTAKAQARLSG